METGPLCICFGLLLVVVLFCFFVFSDRIWLGAQAVLELTTQPLKFVAIPLPHSPRYWDYRCELPCPVWTVSLLFSSKPCCHFINLAINLTTTDKLENSFKSSNYWGLLCWLLTNNSFIPGIPTCIQTDQQTSPTAWEAFFISLWTSIETQQVYNILEKLPISRKRKILPEVLYSFQN